MCLSLNLVNETRCFMRIMPPKIHVVDADLKLSFFFANLITDKTGIVK